MEMLVAITIFAGLAGLSVSVLARAADSFARSRESLSEMRAASLSGRQFAARARLDYQVVEQASSTSLTMNGVDASSLNGAAAEDLAQEPSERGDLLVLRDGAGNIVAARRLRANAPRACRFDAVGRRCLTVTAQ